jgi:hypothetical protein
MKDSFISVKKMSQDVLDLISKIGAQESSLTKRTFVSPNFNNDTVATRVEGIVYSFSVPKKEGWFKFQPVNTKRARVVGPADMMEIEEYLKQLGKVRVVLVMKQQGLYMGIPDKTNNYGLGFNNLMPIYLCGDYPNDFDRVIARYDGANLWYERVDSGNDPAKGDYLRECMAKITMPEKVKFWGLTLEEKHAYALRMTFDKKFVEEQKKDTIKQDVEFAGGKFIAFNEKSDHFAVTYTVEGQQFTTRVTKDPRRMVISAGLCLAGDDHKFDLKSLVTVIREAQEREIVHIQ